MRNTAMALTFLCLASTAFAQTPKTEDEKTIYSLGVMMGKDMGQLSLTKGELEMLKRGLTDGATNGKTLVNVDEYRPKIQALAQTRNAAAAKVNEEASKGFL